ARIPTKGSKKAAGHDLYSMKEVTVPARGQVLIGTGIAIGHPENTYARIAPRSGLASRNGITTNAGVIDADYTGEIRVLLANLSKKDHQIRRNDRIAQMIIKKIVMSDLQEVQELEKTGRGQKGFGSTNEDSKRNKTSEEKPLEIAFISAESFGRMYRQGNTTGILRWDKKGTMISATTISTELALRKQKKGTHKDLRDMVPREYHEFLSMFEEKERKDL